MVAVTLFVVSMSTFMFFFGVNGTEPKELKTDVVNEVTESIDVKSLQDDEKNYRKLVNNQEDPVFVMNLDGTIKFSSWDVENTLGYKQEDLDHQIFFSMLHPDDLSLFLGAFGKVLQNKKPVTMVGPYRLRGKDGQYHIHMGSLFPILTQDVVTQIAISSKDIGKKVDDDDKSQEEQVDPPKPAPAPAPTPKPAVKSTKKPQPGRFLADLTDTFSTGVYFGSGG